MYKFIGLLLVVTMTSCFTERIELDYNQDENKKVIITGWLTDLNEPQIITVQNTVNYLGNNPADPISDAFVTISDSRQTYELSHRTDGQYVMPDTWQAIIGDTYNLVVEYNGNTYTSAHKMRACPEIENFFMEEVNDITETDSVHIYQSIFSFQEMPGEGDAYYGIDYIEGSIEKDTLFNGQFTNDDFVDGEYFEDVEISDYDRLFKVGDKVTLDIFSIGYETSEYLIDVQTEVFRGGLFDTPPANVRSNISGGALGYFIASGANRQSIIVQ